MDLLHNLQRPIPTQSFWNRVGTAWLYFLVVAVALWLARAAVAESVDESAETSESADIPEIVRQPIDGDAVADNAGSVGDVGSVLAEIETYLNSFETVRSPFIQVAPDGGVSEGTIYIHRPERMRVEYEPPALARLVARDGWLTFWDNELGQMSQIQTRSMPAHFLLRREIRLSGDVTPTGIALGEHSIEIGLVQTAEPELGELTLFFDRDPLALRHWVVRDAQGLETTVRLSDPQTDVSLDPDLFDAPPPIPQGRQH